MFILEVLEAILESSNLFYGVLRVLKMTSMAKFNEITKHAKVRDLSLRVPLRILGAFFSSTTSISFLDIMTNSDKCDSVNVNIVKFISELLLSYIGVIIYGEKGFSLCSKFVRYSYTTFKLKSAPSCALFVSGLNECILRIQFFEIAFVYLEIVVLECLYKTYNKRRQAAITDELLEVIFTIISRYVDV